MGVIGVRDAAIRRGCTMANVYLQVRAGRLSGARKVDGQWQIPIEALDRWPRRRQRRRVEAAVEGAR